MRRSFMVFALACAMGLVLASCASTKDTGFPPTPTATESEHTTGDASTRDDPAEYDGTPIDVIDNAYEPRYVVVEAGTTVMWAQTGSQPHSVTSDDARAEEPGEFAFDSHPACRPDCMAAGDEYEFTFTEPGEYPYYCVIHGAPGSTDEPVFMNALIIVE